MEVIHAGIGLNLGSLISWLATFASSLVVAFIGNVYMALVILSPTPIIVISSAVVNRVMQLYNCICVCIVSMIGILQNRQQQGVDLHCFFILCSTFYSCM